MDRTSSHLIKLGCRTPPSGGDTGHVKGGPFRDGGHWQHDNQIRQTRIEGVDRDHERRAAARLFAPLGRIEVEELAGVYSEALLQACK